ncbi:MAG: hypothetical protein V7603_1949 [Micromonosporaceae bacterium]
MKLTLCLIVKDEEQYLRDCVMSTRELVDEVVIVDTGSSDRTPDIARELADTFLATPFTGDFATTRNVAVDHATGDWILFLDADERLPAGETGPLRSALERAADSDVGFTLLRYNFFGTGGFYSSRELKVFRRLPALRYERPVNESVGPAITRLGGRVAAAPVVLNHFGQCRPIAVRERKAERYLALMDKGLAERPYDPWFDAYRGLILRTLGRMDEALAAGRRALQKAPDHPVVNLFYGHVVRAAGQPEEALDHYLAGLALAPGDAALRNMVGVQLLALGRGDEADTYFVAAREAEPRLLHTDINRGLVAQSQCRWRDAEALFGRVATENPGFLHEEWGTRTERDYFRCTHFETPFGYAGLGYHLGYARLRAAP